MTTLRLIFSLIFVFSSIFSLGQTTHATGLYEVVQGGSITIHWNVTGTPSCVGDFPANIYPRNVSETGSPTPLTGGIRDFWLTNHSGTGSETFNNVLAEPKDYIFRCTGGGVSDTTTLRVTAPPLPSCSGETRSHCVLPNNTPSGSRVAGSCESGYVGSCSYTCSSGAWGDPHDNSCTLPNAAPNAPAITGPTTLDVDESGSYGFTSTDPDDGDTLHYEVDWDNDGDVEDTLPTGYVSSGTKRSQANDWGSPQTAIFKARAVDNGGHASGWSSYSVTISCPGGTTWSGSACLDDVVLGNFWDGPALSRANAKLKMASRDISFGLERLAYLFGANVQLNWEPVTGGGTITCNITNNKGRADIPANPAGGNAPTGALNTAATYRYTLTCGNGVGPDQSKWVDVQIFPLPTVTLSASPTTIYKGNSSTLTWSSTNADSCTEVGTAFSTGGRKSGTASVSPSITSSYQVTCTGPGGTTTSSPTTVTVIVPTATISADPARVVSGNSSTITWDSTDVMNCNVTGPGGFSYLNNKKDTKTANNITTQSVYTISCTTAGSPVTDSAIVNVVPDFTEF